MKDGPFRRLVKGAMAWRYRVDLGFTRWVGRLRREGPAYDLRGHCTSCGACCETPMIHLNRWLYHTRFVRRAVAWWHRTVNGFELVGWDREAQAMIFRCTHLDPVTRQCDSYESRPGMCRDYPRNLADEVRPRFLDGCTYYAYARNAEAIRASLAELEVSARKRTELEREFYVYEPPGRGEAPEAPASHEFDRTEARDGYGDRPPSTQT